MKFLRRYTARTVLVTTAGGPVKGTLRTADSEVVVLEHVTNAGVGGGPLDGLVVIPVASVTQVQVV